MSEDPAMSEPASATRSIVDEPSSAENRSTTRLWSLWKSGHAVSGNSDAATCRIRVQQDIIDNSVGRAGLSDIDRPSRIGRHDDRVVYDDIASGTFGPISLDRARFRWHGCHKASCSGIWSPELRRR